MEKENGYTKGELCNRNGCKGIIEETDDGQGCSCHINPPCAHCENHDQYCPVCGWSNLEEEAIKKKSNKEAIALEQEQYRKANEEFRQKRDEKEQRINDAYSGKIKLDKLEWYVTESWHSGYKAKGYAPNMTSTEILKHLRLDEYNLPIIRMNEFGGFTLSAFTD